MNYGEEIWEQTTWGAKNTHIGITHMSNNKLIHLAEWMNLITALCRQPPFSGEGGKACRLPQPGSHKFATFRHVIP